MRLNLSAGYPLAASGLVPYMAGSNLADVPLRFVQYRHREHALPNHRPPLKFCDTGGRLMVWGGPKRDQRGQTLAMVFRARETWARVDEMEGATGARALSELPFLQESLRSEPSHWVDHGCCLPPKDPTGHREAQRRIPQMHDLHSHPQIPLDLFCFRGGTS